MGAETFDMTVCGMEELGGCVTGLSLSCGSKAMVVDALADEAIAVLVAMPDLGT